jgi:hypothetical protein
MTDGHLNGIYTAKADGRHVRPKVVERTISHLHNKRRLLVCTDRTNATHDALLSLAARLSATADSETHSVRDS